MNLVGFYNYDDDDLLFSKKDYDEMFDKFYKLVSLKVITKEKFIEEMEYIYDYNKRFW